MKISRLIRALPIAMGVLLTAGLLLLVLGRIARTVEASGEVRINHYQIVRPRVSGIVTEVLAEPGTYIDAGEVLCRLLDYEFERQQLAVRQQLRDVQAQQMAIDRRRHQLLDEIHPLQQAKQDKQLQSNRLEGHVSGSRRRELEIELSRAEEALSRVEDLRDAGLISVQAVNEAKYDKLQAEQRLEQSQIEEQLARESVADAQDTLRLLSAEQRRALAELDAEGSQMSLLLDQLSADIEQLEKISDQYVVRAEIGGVIIGAPINDLLGRKVQPGEELFSIIDLAAVHFITYVPEAAILRVRAGQRAYVELTGLPRRSFDVFVGEVQKVAEAPQLQQTGKEIRYPVEIRLRQPWVVWEGNRFYVRSGMRGQAKIAYREDVSLLRAIYESLAGEPGGSALAASPDSSNREQPGSG